MSTQNPESETEPDESSVEERLEELEAEIEELRSEAAGVSRRDLLKGAGALGVGGLLGGAATSASTDRARAAIGDDGILGASDDPWDAYLSEVGAGPSGQTDFVDPITAPAVGADELLATDDILVLGGGNAFVETIDPTTTTTPITDAHTLALTGNGGGTIILPSGTIQEAGNISNAADEVSMYGQGIYNTFIEITSDTDDGFVIAPGGGISGCEWSGFAIRPATTDGTRTSGHAINFNGVAGNFNVGSLLLNNWSGAEAIGCDGSNPWSSVWNNVRILMADASDCVRQLTGQSWVINQMLANPSGGSVFGAGDGSAYAFTGHLKQLNVGGNPNRIVGGLCDWAGSIGGVNIEPNANITTDYFFQFYNARDFALGPVILQEASGSISVDNVVQLASNNANKVIMPFGTAGAPVNNAYVKVTAAPLDAANYPSYFFGSDQDVDDNSAAGAVRCLASAGAASTNIA